jgi:hypothetical protein
VGTGRTHEGTLVSLYAVIVFVRVVSAIALVAAA